MAVSSHWIIGGDYTLSNTTVGAMGLTVLGGMANAYFAMETGRAQAKYQKAVAASMRLQASLIRQAMETNRKNNITVAAGETHKVALAGIAQKSAQRSAMSASGINESGYNAEALLRETENATIQDIDQINENLRNENYALWQKATAEAGNMEMKASLAEYQGRIAKKQGYANASLTLLNSIVQAGIIGYDYLDKTGQLYQESGTATVSKTKGGSSDNNLLSLGLTNYYSPLMLG